VTIWEIYGVAFQDFLPAVGTFGPDRKAVEKAEDEHEYGDDYDSEQQILVPESSNHQTSATQLKTLDPEER